MQIESRTCQACLSNYAEMQLCLRKSTKIFWNDKMFGGFLSIQSKKSRRLAALQDERYVKEMYLETTDYQLFAVYTVEKWIGICLKGCGVLWL